MSDDEHAWFAPKLFGFGFGVPIARQGWALALGYLALVVALIFTLRDQPMELIAALVLPTFAFLVIGCTKTRGGCHWRWGGRN
jgi:hypothetical protein